MLALCQSCADGSSTTAWSWASLAWVLGLVAVAALAVGLAVGWWGGLQLARLRAATAQAAALRRSHDAVRHLEQLHSGWLWRTDAQHAVTQWQGPGLPVQAVCVLFDDTKLNAHLRAERAFADVRVRATGAVDGSRVWLMSAVPRHDDQGRFGGFVGTAQPMDLADAERADAAALAPLLAGLDAPATVLLDDGRGWCVAQANAAAREAWPQLQTGGAPGFIGSLPAAVAHVLDEAMAPSASTASTAATASAAPAAAGMTAAGSTPVGSTPAGITLAGLTPASLTAAGINPAAAALQSVAGWKLARLQHLPPGQRGLVLQRAASAAPAGDAHSTAESDNFSFTVSHDLRAPIRVVEGFTRIVKEDYGRLLDRVGNDHLDRVLGAAARMNLMIDALLTLARLSSQPLAHQPVNLSQLADYVIDELRRAAPEREADIDIQPGLATQGDPTLLRLVLENLLGNAWKYSGRSSRTHISLRLEQHGSGREARAAYVVRDNGAGFDMRSSDRLFGLFQRLHSASEFPGHGVGLASVRRIVRRHGGEIWAEAEPGKGAAFFFTLG